MKKTKIDNDYKYGTFTFTNVPTKSRDTFVDISFFAHNLTNHQYDLFNSYNK